MNVPVDRPPVGLVLAAGGGSRMGSPKALLRLPDGRLLVERAVDALIGGGCSRVVVVLGAAADEVRRLARFGASVSLVDNPEWETGMGSSLRIGLDAMPPEAPAAVVLLVDTPGIGARAVAEVAELAGPEVVTIATYGGRRGHPVMLGREHWPAVRALATGDAGARRFLAGRPDLVTEVPCDGLGDPEDLDTAEAWDAWRHGGHSG